MLVPYSLAVQLPAIYASDGVPVEQRKVMARFFDPQGPATWYALEADALTDPHTETWEPLAQAVAKDAPVWDVKFFGLVTGRGVPELGYFLLSELQAYRGRLGLGIDRDAFFRPDTLAAVRSREGV